MSEERVPAIGPIVLRIPEVAEALRCTTQHVRNLIERGELRGVTIGTSRTVRVPVVDLYRILGLDPERDAIGGGK